jgi:pentatricopeptide repeat protein
MNTLADRGRHDECAWQLRQAVLRGLAPSAFSYGILVKACARARPRPLAAQAALYFSELVAGGARPGAVVYGTMIHLAAKTHDPEWAARLFAHMRAGGVVPSAKVRVCALSNSSISLSLALSLSNGSPTAL